MGGPQPTQQPDKPAGPAEAAPEEEEVEPDLPPLPAWPGLERKKVQFFELHGYFRMRADLQSAHSLGWPDRVSAFPPRIRFPAPFPYPVSENPASENNCAGRSTGDPDADVDGCPNETLAGANMRLRLEPTLNVSDTVKVHAQIDIFDNLVLGSTPAGLSGTARSGEAALDIGSTSQAPPIAGRNTTTPAILVKRAWAEVGTPIGLIEAGRQPFQWGLGIFANDGSCWDCNFGDNVDRIKYTTPTLWGHKFGMGFDFAVSGPTSFSVESGQTYFGGQAIDIENLDDVDQWFWFAGKIDDEETIRDRVLRGDVVINYGVYLLYRFQDFSYADGVGLGSTEDELAASLVRRDAWMLIPDAWLKLRWKHLSVDLEGIFVGGNVGNVDQENEGAEMSIVQFGWIARGQYRFLRDKLKVGLEVGMASGDQNEPENQDINRRRRSTLRNLSDPNASEVARNDTSLNEFQFNPDYLVDLILFRELLGTVANAIYFKPTVSYDFLDTLGAKLDIIYSMAHRPIAFPGNEAPLGLELNLDLYYRNIEDGIHAGLQYGILFPFGGLNRPLTLDGEQIFPSDVAADASIAQTLQARLIVNF